MINNQILTSEEMLNELNASFTSLRASQSIKYSDFYLSSDTIPQLWTTDNDQSSEESSPSSESEDIQKCKYYQRKPFVTSDPDSKTSGSSANNSKTSSSLTSSSRYDDFIGEKLTSTSSSSYLPLIKRRKRFRKRVSSEIKLEKSQNPTNPPSCSQSKFKFNYDSLPDLRTKIYKKYLRKIKSEYLQKSDNIPNCMMELNYQSESDQSNTQFNRFSRSRRFGSTRRRIPLKRRATSPSIHVRQPHRSLSSTSSISSPHHSRYSRTSSSSESEWTLHSGSHTSIENSSASNYTRPSIHRNRAFKKYSSHRCYFKYSPFPRFFMGYRLHYNPIPYFQQTTSNVSPNIDYVKKKQADDASSESTSWFSFVWTLSAFAKIMNFFSVIKNKLSFKSHKEDTCNVETTYTQTSELPSESSTTDFGDLEMDIQGILKDAHQPACGGRYRLISKSIDSDVELRDNDTRYWKQL